MWTPSTVQFDYVGPVESFQIKLYRASDDEPLHGTQVPVAEFTKVGDTYSLSLGTYGFAPNGAAILDHEDVYLTVKAISGVDASPEVGSDSFQFRLAMGVPANIVLL